MSVSYKVLYISLLFLFNSRSENDTIHISNNINLITKNIEIIKNRASAENDSILYLAKQTLNISKEINFSEGIYQSYFYIGRIFQLKNLNDSALFYYNLGLQNAIEDTDFKVQFIWEYAKILWLTGNYAAALENNLKIKEIIESNKSGKYSYQIYNSLGMCYKSLLEFDLAIENFKKSLDLAISNNKLEYSGLVLTNMGSIYFDREMYDEALKYLKEGVILEEKYELNFNACFSYNEIATIYLKRNTLDSAWFYIQKADSLSTISKNNIASASTYLTYANYCYKTNELQKAKEYTYKLLEISNKSNYKKLSKDGYKLLSEICSAQKDYQSAFEAFKNYNRLYSQLYNVHEINKAKAFEQKLILREKEKENIEIKLQRQKTISTLLIILVSLILISGIIILINLFKFRKLSRALKRSKEKAEESDKLKSKFLQIISHEIRTPLNGIIGFSDMIRSKRVSDREMSQINDMINKSSDDLISTIENLVDVAHLSTNQFTIRKSKFKLIPLLEKTMTLAKENVIYRNKKKLDLILEKSIDIELNADKNIVQKLILHLVKNAILYTEKGSVTVGYQVENSNLILYVKDTGIGISKEKIDKIFSPFQQADENINIKVGGTGLGLTIVNGLIEIIGGKIWVGSELKKGSTFYVKLPLQ